MGDSPVPFAASGLAANPPIVLPQSATYTPGSGGVVVRFDGDLLAQAPWTPGAGNYRWCGGDFGRYHAILATVSGARELTLTPLVESNSLPRGTITYDGLDAKLLDSYGRPIIAFVDFPMP